MRRQLSIILAGVAMAWTLGALAADWQPVPGNLLTPWSAKVDPRESAAGVPAAADGPRRLAEPQRPVGLRDRRSGRRAARAVRRQDPRALLRRVGAVRREEAARPPSSGSGIAARSPRPSLAGGKRLLLHFGAVDWEAVVSVNGKEVGTHRGGYDPFTLRHHRRRQARRDNELVVRVWDSTGADGEPKGKQHFPAIKNPGGIMYTPCSGIWQTVWLETVPAASIDVAEARARRRRRRAARHGRRPRRADGHDGRSRRARTATARSAEAAGKVGSQIVLPMPNAKLWSPDSPFLYDLKVSLTRATRRSTRSRATSACARSRWARTTRASLRPMLNGKFVFQVGPLDQGFWPDGIYTAPTDEALRFDIEATRKLGFNMARKHVKVEPDRWYYWCDKLGLLVWQDMPSGGGGKGDGKEHDGVPASPERAAQFEAELKAMVERSATIRRSSCGSCSTRAGASTTRRG